MADARAQLAGWLARQRPDTAVEFVETHMSVLGFQGDRAYKLKKPVRFAFVDLSTAEQRRVDCEREVELNRRFAPDVYRGVRSLTDERGLVVDHVIEMKRLPDDRRLASLVSRGIRPDACLRQLARNLAAFHRSAETGGAIDDAARGASIARIWELGIEQLAAYDDVVIPHDMARCVATLARNYVTGRTTLFEERIADGRARDGHGDLLADDVFCLDDGPRAIDCLEFDDRLRYGDGLSDAAFLAMDLERLGHHDLAYTFLDEYRQAETDDWPESLAHMYIAYRAHVRTKVACLRHDQGDPDAAAQARTLLALAHRHLEDGRVRLILVGGPPASGKSTLAHAIAAETGWEIVRSDVIRKEAFGEGNGARRVDAPLDSGLYDPAISERTYAWLLDRARAALVRGRSIVVDASWSRETHRGAARRIASETASEMVELHCDAPEVLRVERARERADAGQDVSDAGPKLAAALSSRFDPWPSADLVDTTRSEDVVTASVLSDLHRDACTAV